MNLPWTPPEKRWRDALLDAMIPTVEGVDLPGIGELDLESFWRRYGASAPPLLQLGFRGAVWGLTWGPALLPGTGRPLHRLSRERRAQLLSEANHSRSYVVRQLVMMAKTVASLGYFNHPQARAAVESKA